MVPPKFHHQEDHMAQSLPQRALGKSGINVSAIGLGCMSFSGVYGPSEDAAAVTLINQALDAGITMLDSSDAYGKGQNETLVGNAIKSRRADVVLATKFGNLGGAGGKYADGRPEFVVSSCEASLKRLGVEVIDLYYQHRIDPTVPIEDTVGAMAKLVQQGKVRALGLSEARPDTIRRAHKVHPVAAVQNEYSLLYRSEGEETLRTCRELGITLVAYAPLGRSMLTGSVHGKNDLPEGDRRLQHPRFQGEALDKNVALLSKLEEIAKEKRCKVTQLVLAWLLAQGKDIVPIPGTKRKERFDENLGALAVKLDASDLKRISDAAPA